MGCRWITIRGRRVRVGPAAPARLASLEELGDILDLLSVAGVKFVRLSPEVPIEELENPVLRIWLDPETGYMVEVRSGPAAPPIYHHITADEARSLQIRRPSRELLERLFSPEEPGIES